MNSGPDNLPAGPTQAGQAPPPGYGPPSGYESPPGYGPPPAYVPPPPRKRNDVSGAFVLGLLLILAGAYFLTRQFLPALDLALLWPVVVIVIGAVLIVMAFTRKGSVQ